MSSPFEGYSTEASFDLDCEQLLLATNVQEARTSYLVMASSLYAEPTSINKQAFDALSSAWVGTLRDFVEFVLDHARDLKTEHTPLDLLAIQYLHETAAINQTFASLTGNTDTFFVEDIELSEIGSRLEQPVEGVDDEKEAIFSQFMRILGLDCEVFLAHVDALENPDEDEFFPLESPLGEGPDKPAESRARRLAKQTLKVAGYIASTTFAVYLGNTLSERTSSRR